MERIFTPEFAQRRRCHTVERTAGTALLIHQFSRHYGFLCIFVLALLLVAPVASAAVPTASSVNITGTPDSGEVLTGNYTYDDTDGDLEGVSTFRWLRNDVEIGGEVAITYLLTNADQGTTIKFEVTPVADTGELTGVAVESAGLVITDNVAPTATSVSISGAPESGEELTGNYTYNDDDGDAEGTSTFEWLRDGTPISGATAQTYTLTNTDQGTTIIFEVTPVAATGTSPGAAVPSAGLVITDNVAPTATSVSISGTPESGEELTGNYTYNDDDGDAEGTSTFEWLRDGTPISGATAQTYTLTNTDQGTTIIFEVTPVAATGTSPGAAVPSAGLVITDNVAPTATSVSISGAPESGEELTGNYTYNDDDGDAEGTSTFEWLRDGTPISGATAQTYTLTNTDQGTTIIFEVTPVAATGTSPGAAVPSAGLVITDNVAPTATSVSISGTPESGEELTGNYTYNDDDGDAEGTSTFEWLRDGTPISGATAQTYTLTNTDQGTTIIFEVTPVAATGTSPGAAVPSAGLVITDNVAPTATSVSISGTPESGEELTGNYTYNDDDGDAEGTSTFEWLRDGTPISGATAQTYTLTNTDQGTTIIFEVTPVAAAGTSPGAAVPSAGVVITANVVPTATAVSITGTLQVGETLTGNYTYSDDDGDAEGTSTFEWLRDGTPIASASAQTYVVDQSDKDTSLSFSITPVAATGASPGVAVESATVSIINIAPIANDDSFDVSEGGSPVAGSNVLTNDTDPDQDPAVLTAELVSGPTLDPAFVLNSDGTFTYVHDDSETLSDSFTYQACDTDAIPLCSSTATVTINVDEVNDPPVIEAQVALATAEETALTITLADITVTDVDSDSSLFVLSVQDGTDYTRVDNTITPITDFNGDLTVPVTVSDGTDTSEVFNLIVTVDAANDTPVITDQLVLETPEDTPLTILITDLVVTDPDNVFPDDFTLLLLDGTSYTRVDNTITPDANFNGTLSVPATVSDGLLTSAEFVLTVEVTAENDAPVLETPIGVQFAIEGTAFSLNVLPNFTDAENDPLTFTVTGLPVSNNLSIDPATGIISGTPAVEDARDNDPYIVTVTAADSALATAEDTFELNISPLDRANVSLVIEVAPAPAMLNDELNWTFTASNFLGPQAATNVVLTGTVVGSGLNITSAGTCDIQAAVGIESTFECLLGDLTVGGSSTVVLTTVTSSPGDVVVFGTAATADELPLDPVLEDNSSQLAVGVAEAFSNGAVQVLGNTSVRSVAAGDVDGDGINDLVVGTAAGQSIQIYVSGGFRDFLTSPIAVADTSSNDGLALADFDGNGTLDLAVANGGGQQDLIFSNGGAGDFTTMAALPELTVSRDVAVGDFNNDSLLDVVFATLGGNPVFLGDGIGGFVADSTLGVADSYAVAVADFDGDGLDDIVFANVGSDSQVWTRNAGGGFIAGELLAIGDASSVTVAEFDGIAGPDLAFGRIPSAPGDVPANPVLINDGNGVFGSPVALLGSSPTSDILAGDVNEDGLTDLVFINSSGVHQIWTANGGSFDLHREQIVDGDSMAGVLTDLGMTDVGDRGGVDLAMGGASVAGLGVFLNDGFGNLGMGDAVIPVLTLLGEATLDIASGSVYADAGASAEDNIDGNINSRIVVNNPVNTSTVGAYTVTYNVTDAAGNPAVQITRSVTVQPAVGTGGGGGGAVNPFIVFFLMLSALLAALVRANGAKHAIILAGGQKQE